VMNLWTNEEIEKILITLDKMELPFKKYSILQKNGTIKTLGKGSSANVYEAFTRRKHKPGYAIKVIGFFNQNVDSDFFNKTIELQENINRYNDYFVKIYNHTEIWVVFDSNENILSVVKDKPEDNSGSILKLQFIVMEKLPAVINTIDHGKIKITPNDLYYGDENEILKIAYDIGIALQKVHENNILHRDIKLENIFYSEKKKVYKLGDFGIAKKTQDGFARTVAFTRGYAAPEVCGMLDSDVYDYTADIYSFGMMLYVLANHFKFPDSNAYYANIDAQYSNGYVLPKPENDCISDEFYNIIVKACMYAPNLRYQSIEEMLVDIGCLIFNKSITYKKEHKIITLMIAIIFVFLGAISGKLLMVHEMIIKFSLIEYIFIITCITKGVQEILNKDTAITNAIMLFIGLYYLFTNSFSWYVLFVIIVMLVSSGLASGVFGMLALVLNIISLYQLNTGVRLYHYYSYDWISIAFFSLAVVFFYDYYFLSITERRTSQMVLKKSRFFWGIVYLCYISLIISPRPFFYYWPMIQIKALNKFRFMMWGIDFKKVGVFGIVFVTFWIIRERVVTRVNNQR